jgi:hypothetical protein
MMIIGLTAALVLSVFIGYLILEALLGSPVLKKNLLFSVSALIGIGVGTTSALWFIAQISGIPYPKGIILELSLIAVLLTRKHFTTAEDIQVTSSTMIGTRSLYQNIFLVALLFQSIISALNMLVTATQKPYGEWDAWSIWNVKARYIFRSGEQWIQVLNDSDIGNHPDYPLLLSGSIVRYWQLMGMETQYIPVLLGIIFTFATAGTLVSTLRAISRPTQGYIAGIILLGTPMFLHWGASQYADVPISFYFLLAISSILLAGFKIIHEKQAMIICGLACGFASWTKNEGMVFTICALISISVVKILQGYSANAVKSAVYFLLGLLPMGIILVYFKIFAVPPNEIASAQTLDHFFSTLFSLERYKIIFSELYQRFSQFHHWLYLPLLLILYLCLGGIDTKRIRNGNFIVATFIIMGMLFGYFAVYLLTPYALEWHISTSADRLLVHLWPSMLLIAFIAAVDVE